MLLSREGEPIDVQMMMNADRVRTTEVGMRRRAVR